MVTRAKWVAGLATLILVGASVGVALGQVNASVDVQLGRIVKVNGGVKFTVSGYVSGFPYLHKSYLVVYVSETACSAIANDEARHPRTSVVVSEHVLGRSFSKDVQTTPGVNVVPVNVCAYVIEFEPGVYRTLAYASARAAASTGYSVAFTSVGRLGAKLRSIVTVNAHAKASLLVFGDRDQPCLATAEQEERNGRAVRQLLRRNFESGVSDRPEPVPPEVASSHGTVFVCAYLEVHQRITVAHAEASFEGE
jgi:hypothetical protein